MIFEEFPKIGRLTRDMVITEKIDGTNAQVAILPKLDADMDGGLAQSRLALGESDDRVMLAGSRSQWITPERDNHGFAKWVAEHAAELFALGNGRHFGEWWGAGIQRRYGLAEKRFSLFNVGRWVDTHKQEVSQREPMGKQQYAPACCHVVPVLLRWSFVSDKIEEALGHLRAHGSFAAPGFMNPEGVVVFHSASGALFKKTLERDDEPKSMAASSAVSPPGRARETAE